jgi:hypothetical protein
MILISCATKPSIENKWVYDKGIVLFSLKNSECLITLRGNITPALVRPFTEAVDMATSTKCASKWIQLDSPGGSVEAALSIGALIRLKQLNTSIIKSSCSSSCGLIFASGVKRAISGPSSFFIESYLGFHQIFNYDGDFQVCREDLASPIWVRIKDHLNKMLPANASNYFYNLMRLTDCTKTLEIDSNQAMRYGIATQTARD